MRRVFLFGVGGALERVLTAGPVSLTLQGGQVREHPWQDAAQSLQGHAAKVHAPAMPANSHPHPIVSR